jgi:hypothetical protein
LLTIMGVFSMACIIFLSIPMIFRSRWRSWYARVGTRWILEAELGAD